MKLLSVITILVLSILPVSAFAIGGSALDKSKRAALQTIVTYDEHSLMIRGERILIWSGEFHPIRLPVPALWLDVFQKIRSMGYSAVSFYVHWALLEGKAGDFSAEGVFDLTPFFAAASEAGIYLIARPGPYVNAEFTGGGFPGWLTRIKGEPRTSATDYTSATDLYMSKVGAMIAAAQITNGGPVILVQPENEYGGSGAYMAYVETQLTNAGIVVPFINNDPSDNGHNAPGTGTGAVDIYSYDQYPVGFSCGSTSWGATSLPTGQWASHLSKSPATPHSISEFQGGSIDLWGAAGYEACNTKTNQEFERIFYKNEFASGIKHFSIYMTYGGTNWGNLGQPTGYTSYDYGSAIKEDRTITREKFSEAKLEVNFFKVATDYLVSVPENITTSYTNSADISITPITNTNSKTKYWVARHTTYNSGSNTAYKLQNLPTSAGSLTIPQLSGSLSLNGLDTKIHVTDFKIGNVTLLYSTAEIFTVKVYSSYSVLIVYGGPGEQHEIGFSAAPSTKVLEGTGVTFGTKSGATILNWSTTTSRQRITIGGNLQLYILDRNSAYNYWVTDIPGSGTAGNYSSSSASSVVTHAGYLIRSAKITGSSLYLTGDLNATTPLEIIGAPSAVSSVYFNGAQLAVTTGQGDLLSSTLTYVAPSLTIPTLSTLTWKYVDSLPEIQSTYDDSKWTVANSKTSNNTWRVFTTPTDLYADDYGYHVGQLIYRGRFTATGKETSFRVWTQGGAASSASVWLGTNFLGSYAGTASGAGANTTFTLPTLTSGEAVILTVVIDHMGNEEDWTATRQNFKTPRGILDYTLSGRDASAITWKMTGNLGGETYADRTRGPRNEGGSYAERQGWHLPSPPSASWKTSSPMTGLTAPGIGFYSTSFDLNLPSGYDIPLAFTFTDAASAPKYRVQLFVNGYQFGKYLNYIGPQTSFPVPEGILNYQGTNYLSVTLWALNSGGAKIGALALTAGRPLQWAYGPVTLVDAPAYQLRSGAY